MTPSEYQQLASRTLAAIPETDRLILGAIGLAGEAGEVCELIKKYRFHGQPLDHIRLSEEIGDALWYLAAVATSAGLDLDQIAEGNIAKLRLRHPAGFTHATASAKADLALRGPSCPDCGSIQQWSSDRSVWFCARVSCTRTSGAAT